MTAFSWSKAADGDVTKLPAGYHRCVCTKVSRANKDGKEYQSKDGDPQILTIWENADGESAVAMFTLTNKAAWTLAQMLKYAGADIEKMEANGITPKHFEDIAFAEKQILKRECWVYAEPKGKYVNIDFVAEDSVPAEAIKQATQPIGSPLEGTDDIDDDDIPF